MADMMSIIAANYKTVGTTIPTKTPYVAVDPTLYEGSWTGKYANQKTFKITVSNITGFRAKVQYQSDGTSKFQEVLIKDNAFRVGDTKFALTGHKYGGGQERRHRRRQRADLPRSGLREAFLSGAESAHQSAIQSFLRSTKTSIRIRRYGRWRQGAAEHPWSSQARGNRRGGAARLPRETGSPPGSSWYR